VPYLPLPELGKKKVKNWWKFKIFYYQ
jgi:hypothetical protein